MLDPDPAEPKRFRVELVMPVDPASIGEGSLRVYALPDSIGQLRAIDAPPGDIGEVPPPVELLPIGVAAIEPELQDGNAVALEAVVDADAVALHAGREIVVQLDPSGWTIVAPEVDDVFFSPMRFTHRVSESGPDGRPPFLVDVAAIATSPLDAVLGGAPMRRRMTTVAPHSPLSFFFSEPLYAAAPVVTPQDPVGLRLEARERVGHGFLELRSETDAGLIPGQDYCVSLLPPRMANLGPLAVGTLDLSGEPIGRPGRRAGADSELDATEVCFRTGGVRLEEPRPHSFVPAASGTVQLEFLSVTDCEPDDCPDAYRVMVRLDDGTDDQLSPDWFDYGIFERDDLDIRPTNGLAQGELLVPADIVLLELPPQPPGGPCAGLFAECPVQVRIDECVFEGCDLGDVIDVVIDLVPPPPVEDDDVTIEDTDINDGVIDRVCVVLEDPEAGESLVIEVEGEEVVFTAADPRVHDERLPDGRIRRCITEVEVDPSPGPTEGVRVWRRDRAGQDGDGASFDLPCQAPPRKHVAFDGRRSAVALDRGGIPHVVHTQGNALWHSRWDAANDEWTSRRVECLCGIDAASNVCLACPGDRVWGWTVDITMNVLDEPVMCWTRAQAPSDDDAVTPGWELEAPLDVRLGVAVIRGDGHMDSTELETDPSRLRNLGCAIEARPSVRTDAHPGDYMIGYSVADPAAPSGLGLALDYLDDPGMGMRFPPPERAGSPSVAVQVDEAGGGGAWRDIAVDGDGFFWVVAQSLPDTSRETEPNMIIMGEHADYPGEMGRIVRIQPLHDEDVLAFANTNRARIDARGSGDVAVAYSDALFRPRYLFRGSTEALEARARFIDAMPESITAYRIFDDFGGPGPAGQEEVSPELLNNGGIASADGLLTGIPIDVDLPHGGQSPARIAWAAGTPAGVDYHAVMLARFFPGEPLPGGRILHALETIDGRVEGSAGVHLISNPRGLARIVFHQGLGDHRGHHPVGSIQFYREEDEDEIHRTLLGGGREPRGDARCFASSLLVQDELDGLGNPVRTDKAGLDNGWAALVPRPAVDPDPCGRTNDAGTTLEVAYRVAELLDGTPPDLRPPSLFKRLPGERNPDFATRTNGYRIRLFTILKSALGDLSFLDAVFPRTVDATRPGWNHVNPALLSAVPGATPDDLLDSGDNRAGGLDAVFLLVGELLDDMCGMTEDPTSCVTDPTGVQASRPEGSELCPSPGAFLRNPNPHFPGLFYTDPSGAPVVDADGDGTPDDLSDLRFDPLADAFPEFRDSQDSRGSTNAFLSDDFTLDGAGLAAGEEPGLLGAAIRGLRVEADRGIFRTADHVCRPTDDCTGVPALPMAGGDNVTVLTGAAVGPPDGSQGDGRCPGVRPGAILRHAADDRTDTPVEAGLLLAGAPELSRIGGTTRGCCTGYEPVACAHDAECLRVGTRVVVPDEDVPRLVGGRCDSGFCQKPFDCEVVPRAADGGVADAGAAVEYTIECDMRHTCVAQACSRCEPIYCDDRPAVIDTQPIADALCLDPTPGRPCRDRIDDTRDLNVLGEDVDALAAALAAVRGGACAPGASCRPAEREVFPACIGRQLFGHHTVRALLLAGLAGEGRNGEVHRLIDDLARLLDFQNTPIERNSIREVEIRWRQRFDGDLRLPGQLEVLVRPSQPVTVVLPDVPLPLPDPEVEPFEMRIAYQPYFYAGQPLGSPCDDCDRRNLDMTMHLRGATAGLFVPGTDDIISDVDSCDCAGADVGEFYTDCLIAIGTSCGCPPRVDGRNVGRVRRGPDVISAALTALSRDFEGTVDEVLYRMLADPLVGGLLLGRKEAVESLRDAPTCLPLTPGTDPADLRPTPAAPNPACPPRGTGMGPPDLSPARTRIADTIEAIHVTGDGLAAVRARENR